MIFKCKNCGGNTVYSPEKKTMYCPYCDSLDSEERKFEECDKKVCPNCGGEILVEEHTSALQCSYCDHFIILNDRVEGDYKPVKMIPFMYDRNQVKELMREKFKRCYLAPTDFLSDARLKEMQGEYVPFWMYDYNADCNFHGVGVKTRTWTAGDYIYTEHSYYDVRRDMDITYDNIPVDASVKMTDEIMDLLEPYDYSAMVDFKPEYMSGFLGEKYNMTSDLVEFRAKAKVDDSAEGILKGTIVGYSRMEHPSTNIQTRNINTDFNLLPVWKYIYTYKNEKYPFYINGQSGKIIGKVPVSTAKVFAYGITLGLSIMLIGMFAGIILGVF